MRHLLTCSPNKLKRLLNMHPREDLEILIKEILEFGYGQIEILNERPNCFSTKIITHWHTKYQFELWGPKNLKDFYY